MKRFILFLITGLIFFQGYAMTGDIVGDVKQVRRANKEANIDISDIVKKYIASTADRNTVEDYLRSRKFALNNQPAASDGTQTLVAIYVEKSLLNVGFYDEIRVVVVFMNNKVDRATGKLIFRSL